MKRIFIALGRQGRQFNRLLKEIDCLLEQKQLPADVFAQTDASSYTPKNYNYVRQLTFEEYEQKIVESDLVIGHAGSTTVELCLHHEKPMIVVPRLKRFGETNSDNQLLFARGLEKKGKAMLVEDISDLGKRIEESRNFLPWVKSERARLIIRLTLYIKGEKAKG